MKSLKNYIYISFAISLSLFFSALLLLGYARIAKADESIDLVQFEKDISFIKESYELVTDLCWDDNSVEMIESLEKEMSLACSSRLKYNEMDNPVVSSTDTVTIDTTNVDAVIVYVSGARLGENGWENDYEGSLYSFYLFNVNSLPTLTFTQALIANVDVEGITDRNYSLYEIVTYKKTTDSVKGAFFFSNVCINSISKYNGFIQGFDYVPEEPSITVGVHYAGYVQGVFNAAMDLASASSSSQMKMPEESANWTEEEKAEFENGYDNGYSEMKNQPPTYPNYSSNNESNSSSESNNKFLVKIYDYDVNMDFTQVATIQVNVGDKITLEQIEETCGRVIDTRWSYATVDENGNDVVKNWNFDNTVTSSLDLLPKGCTLTIFDEDYKTELGSFKVPYNTTVTLEQFEEACDGVLASESYDRFFILNDEVHIVNIFDFDEPVTMDVDLCKHFWNVTIFNNDTGDIMAVGRVDDNAVLSDDLVNEILGTKKYIFNSCSDWGTTSFEIGDKVNCDLLVVVKENVNYQESEDGSTSLDKPNKGNSGVPSGFEINTAGLGSILSIVLVVMVVVIIIRRKNG